MLESSRIWNLKEMMLCFRTMLESRPSSHTTSIYISTVGNLQHYNEKNALR